MILVIGATGTNGREVVQRLAGAGHRVRALVRNPAKADGLRLANVELARGDLDDPASLDRAFRGVSRAFVVTAVDQRAVGWFRNAFDAAKRAGNPHVVKFSGMGAGVADPELLRQHAESDEMLQSSGLPYTILRPNSFFQNMLWSAGTIRDHGAFYLPMRDGRQSLVDVRDIAAVAGKVLTETGHEGQVYEVTGPESLSYADVAATLTRVLGKPVRYVDVSPETARESMLKAGMPAWNADAVTELYGAFATGKFDYTTDAVERITGQPPITFERFAAENAAAFCEPVGATPGPIRIAMSSEWTTAEHALAYLQMADRIPHRTEGEATLLEEVPKGARRVLDLGSGDGRLLGLLLLACPAASGVAVEFSPPMLGRLRQRFAKDDRVEVVEHDLEHRLPPLGAFDAVASSFAIHHLPHPRKRELYREVWAVLEPGGVFCNLEHVASPSARVHERFLDALDVTPDQEDRSNKLLDVEAQLRWLREIGFEDVDCYWKWRELALLVGRKPKG